MSGTSLPEVRGSHLAGQLERRRALARLMRQSNGSRHVQLELGEVLTVSVAAPIAVPVVAEEIREETEEVAKNNSGLSVVAGTVTMGPKEWIDPNLLDPCSLQPDVRTDDRAIRGLEQDIIAAGDVVVVPIAVVPGRNGRCTIADGHRRREIALKRGHKKVPIQKAEGVTAEFLWALLNAHVHRITAANWFTTWAKKKGNREEWLRCIPSKIRGNIRRFVQVLGEEKAVSIGLEEWCDPSVVNIASRVHLMIQTDVEKCPTKRRVLEWMLAAKKTRSNLMFQWIRTVGTKKCAQRKLRTAITRGKDHPAGEW